MIQVNKQQIEKFSDYLNHSGEVVPFDFTGSIFPEKNHHMTAEYFFVLVKHQFSFWYIENNRYKEPMISEIDGESYKGSDYIWAVGTRLLKENIDFFSPEYQRDITLEKLKHDWRNAHGDCPLPVQDEHLKLMNGYGEVMSKSGYTGEKLIKEAMKNDSPMKFLTQVLSEIPGYKEDPLSKKLNMLI